MSSVRHVTFVAAVLSLSLLNACADDVVDPLATARIEIVSGQQQSGDVGGALGQPISVRVLTRAGTPLAGVTVQWLVLEGGGAADPAESVTDANGVASTNWTLGEAPGVQALLARAPTASARIEATASLHFAGISAGFRHTCALSTRGKVYCWGLNDRGQLGIGTFSTTAPPTPVAGEERFRMISAGWFHTCGVTEAFEIYCWGDNSVGQLGSPGDLTAVPRKVASSERFQHVSSGYHHTCASTENKVTWCWGSDETGALGSNGTTPACFATYVPRCTSAPQRVAGDIALAGVVAGEFHSCARAPDGLAYCWGWNSNGQIGNLGPANAIFDVPTRVISNRGYRSFGVGARHTCAITTAERLECWGRNAAGEIGVVAGTALGAPEPLASTLLARVVDAGETHSCALGADQRVYCWGSLLGNGTNASSTTPVAVAVNGAATSVGAGGEHACAIVDEEAWCWGSNSDGQLGVSGLARSESPVRVPVDR